MRESQMVTMKTLLRYVFLFQLVAAATLGFSSAQAETSRHLLRCTLDNSIHVELEYGYSGGCMTGEVYSVRSVRSGEGEKVVHYENSYEVRPSPDGTFRIVLIPFAVHLHGKPGYVVPPPGNKEITCLPDPEYRTLVAAVDEYLPGQRLHHYLILDHFAPTLRGADFEYRSVRETNGIFREESRISGNGICVDGVAEPAGSSGDASKGI